MLTASLVCGIEAFCSRRFNLCATLKLSMFRAITCTRITTTCVYITVSNYSAVVGIYMVNCVPHFKYEVTLINPLNAELNPICYLLALLGAHHFLHVGRIRVKSLTLRLLMSYIYIYIYIYGAPILDVSRSHTTTHHSR